MGSVSLDQGCLFGNDPFDVGLEHLGVGQTVTSRSDMSAGEVIRR